MGTLAHFHLASIRLSFGLRAFVETGTANGDGVQLALAAGFDPVHSVEIMPNLAQAARLRFEAYKGAQIWEGASARCLPMLLKELPAEPTLFWLDAHFPNAHGHGSTYTAEPDAARRLPLHDELRTIHSARPTSRDVILIDDARIYVPGPYQDGDAPPELLPALQGVDRGPHGLDFVRELYGGTHGVVIDYCDQGYVYVFPRKQA